MGYLADANTIALWEQDDAKVPARIITTDLTGDYDFASVSDTLSVLVGGDPSRTQGKYSIGADPTRDRRIQTPKDVALTAAMKGEFTFEWWAHMESTDAGGTLDRYFFSDWVAGTGTTAGLFSVGHDPDDWIILYTKADGTTIFVKFGAGPTTGGWHHYAAVVEVSGSDRTISIYIDGVFDASTVAGDVDQAASTGSLNDFAMISPAVGGGLALNGLMSALRLTDIAQTPAQLVINAARPGFDLPTDGDTILNCDFSDIVPEIDCAVGGHPLVINEISDSGFERFPERATPLIGCLGTNFCRLYDDTINMAYDGRVTPPMTAALHSGNWAWETWIDFNGGSRDRGLFMVAGHETIGLGGETRTNWQLAVTIDLGGGGEHFVQIQWETGLGTIRTVLFTVPFATDDFLAPAGEEFSVAHHLGISSENIGGLITLRVYRDGALLETIATGFGPAEGGIDTHRFRLGTVDVSNEPRCKMQHTMISDVFRDDAWFLASFNEGLAQCSAGGAHRDFPPLPKAAFP